jgi:hypothetical protein
VRKKHYAKEEYVVARCGSGDAFERGRQLRLDRRSGVAEQNDPKRIHSCSGARGNEQRSTLRVLERQCFAEDDRAKVLGHVPRAKSKGMLGSWTSMRFARSSRKRPRFVRPGACSV